MIYGALLVLCLGPIGFLIALCFNDPDYTKGAVITLIIEIIAGLAIGLIAMYMVRNNLGPMAR